MLIFSGIFLGKQIMTHNELIDNIHFVLQKLINSYL